MNALELGRAAALSGCVPGPSRRGVRADGQPRQTYNATPLGTASWVALMRNAQREARAAAGRKTAAARFVEEIWDHAISFGDLRDRRARSVIGAELGGRCPDSVRRAALSAMKLGEIFIDECQGDRARGNGRPWHGKPTNVYVPVRALPLIARMPAAQRAAHLADPTIQRAIAWVKRQAAGGRAESLQAQPDRPGEALEARPLPGPLPRRRRGSCGLPGGPGGAPRAPRGGRRDFGGLSPQTRQPFADS